MSVVREAGALPLLGFTISYTLYMELQNNLNYTMSLQFYINILISNKILKTFTYFTYAGVNFCLKITLFKKITKISLFETCFSNSR